MKKALATILVSLLGLSLMCYTSIRGLSFINVTLPPERQYLGYFALAALDGGMLLWLTVFLYAAQGGLQRAISLILIVVDLVGSVGLALIDAMLQTGASGMTTQLTPEAIQTAVLALSGVIALNVIGVVAFQICDPNTRRIAAEEEAYDQIEEEALKQIAANATNLAAEVAPHIAQAWREQTKARFMQKVKNEVNGHNKEEAKELVKAVPFGRQEGER